MFAGGPAPSTRLLLNDALPWSVSGAAEEELFEALGEGAVPEADVGREARLRALDICESSARTLSGLVETSPSCFPPEGHSALDNAGKGNNCNTGHTIPRTGGRGSEPLSAMGSDMMSRPLRPDSFGPRLSELVDDARALEDAEELTTPS